MDRRNVETYKTLITEAAQRGVSERVLQRVIAQALEAKHVNKERFVELLAGEVRLYDDRRRAWAKSGLKNR